jgi:hypothetical protein
MAQLITVCIISRVGHTVCFIARTNYVLEQFYKIPIQSHVGNADLYIQFYIIIRPCLSAHVFQPQNAKRIYIKSDVESL